MNFPRDDPDALRGVCTHGYVVQLGGSGDP